MVNKSVTKASDVFSLGKIVKIIGEQIRRLGTYFIGWQIFFSFTTFKIKSSGKLANIALLNGQKQVRQVFN
jgi:hypothetical protein